MMKKSVLFLAVALILCITISSCKVHKEDSVEVKSIEKTCPERFVLKNNVIDEMTSKYQNTQLQHINKEMNFDDDEEVEKGDARAIWFSLDVLKEFICQIEDETKLDSDKLGIRIYYAAYPEKEKWDDFKERLGDDYDDIDESYAERHTLVLIPTTRDIEGVNKDYLDNLESLALVYKSHSDKDRPDDSTVHEKKLVKNSGSLFPPEPESGLEF